MDASATAAPPMRVTGITKRYGRVAALDAVGFSIRPGEVLGLIGPNGAGKTTLFECLAGVSPASAGAFLRDDRAVEPSARRSLLFYVPDGITPWPAQPLSWALDFTIGFFGGLAERRDEVVRDLALGTLLAAPLGTLSKGECARAPSG